jgi:AcrR family transcriptional regulator
MSAKRNGAALRAVPSPPVPRRLGRPRSEASRQRILGAARELLEERGLRGMTIEALAERAGTSKVTVYRWWSHKAAVVLDAMLAETSPRMPYRESSSPVEALRDQMRSFVRFLNGRHGLFLAAVAAEGMVDDVVGRAYREHWVKPRRDDARKLLGRAIAAGELADDTDIEVTLDALFGPLYYRLLIKHAPLTRGFAEALFRSVMMGLASGAYRARLADEARLTVDPLTSRAPAVPDAVRRATPRSRSR